MFIIAYLSVLTFRIATNKRGDDTRKLADKILFIMFDLCETTNDTVILT